MMDTALIQQHIKKAGELFKQKLYDESLVELDLALAEDPDNSYALAARQKVATERDLALELRANERQKDIAEKRQTALKDSQNAEYQQRLAAIEEEGRKRREEETNGRNAGRT